MKLTLLRWPIESYGDIFRLVAKQEMFIQYVLKAICVFAGSSFMLREFEYLQSVDFGTFHLIPMSTCQFTDVCIHVIHVCLNESKNFRMSAIFQDGWF